MRNIHLTSIQKVVLETLSIAAAYTVLGMIGQTLAIQPGNVTAVWPPSGLALGLMLTMGFRIWPGIWLGALIVNSQAILDGTGTQSIGITIAIGSFIGVGSVLQPAIGTILIRRFASSISQFNSSSDLVRFVLITPVVCVVSSTIGSASLCIGGSAQWENFSTLWMTWWLGDSVGVLMFAPLILSWHKNMGFGSGTRKNIEIVAAFLAIIVSSMITFHGLFHPSTPNFPLTYLPIPFLIWVAIRFEPKEVTTSLLILAGISAWGTSQGLGPFDVGSADDSLLLLQLYVAFLMATVLFIAVYSQEHSFTKQELRVSRERVAEERSTHQEVELRFRTLIDSSNQGILVHRNHKPLYANQALADMYGFESPDEFLTIESTKSLTHRDYYVGNHIKRMAGEKLHASREAMAIRKDGSEIWEERQAFVINWDGEQAVCSIRMDITERKRTEGALLKAKVEAETSSQVKTAFLANMSHELRTPLNAIIGFSEAILDNTFGSVANKKQEEYVHDINSSGHHLLKLINDILDVTVIEEGKLELQDDQVVIGALVEEISKMVQPRAKAENVTLSIKVDENLFALRGDERRLKQILLNLLTNAIKFTQESGKISLDCRIETEGQIAIVVTDNGIGMSGEDIKTALEPFGQVDAVFIRKYEGTGLGLPLTKQLVELHRGTLEVESKLGIGTTVTVLFPKERVILKSL
jgi:PAS domain S-box-containing protein